MYTDKRVPELRKLFTAIPRDQHQGYNAKTMRKVDFVAFLSSYYPSTSSLSIPSWSEKQTALVQSWQTGIILFYDDLDRIDDVIYKGPFNEL